MFADFFFDLNAMQITCLIGTTFIGMLLVMRSRRNLKNTQQHWDELRSNIQTTEKLTSQNGSTKSSSGIRTDDSSTIYLPEQSLEMDEVEARIRTLEREATARVDTKIAILQQLLIQTDAAINKLQYGLESAVRVGLLDQNPMPRRTVEQSATNAKQNTDSRIIRADKGANQHAHVISGRVSLPPNLDDDPRFVRVYALADGGLSAAKIASQTGMQIGEVELILSLRPKQRANSI